jgi:hypothetical protein
MGSKPILFIKSMKLDVLRHKETKAQKPESPKA